MFDLSAIIAGLSLGNVIRIVYEWYSTPKPATSKQIIELIVSLIVMFAAAYYGLFVCDRP